jgi:hypothetical protein
MTKKNGLFVKINYKAPKKGEENGLSVDKSNLHKFLFCAGTLNKNGGTMIFRAKDFEVADYIANNNPFINSDIYKYEIYQGDVISL